MWKFPATECGCELTDDNGAKALGALPAAPFVQVLIFPKSFFPRHKNQSPNAVGLIMRNSSLSESDTCRRPIPVEYVLGTTTLIRTNSGFLWGLGPLPTRTHKKISSSTVRSILLAGSPASPLSIEGCFLQLLLHIYILCTCTYSPFLKKDPTHIPNS